jgi:8-oxo-dGTP diphosphatase
MTTVVAAVIERDGQVLIGQRPVGKRHGLKWEFPGGKVEPGEAAEAALRRELEEELGIQAVIGGQMADYEYTYPAREAIRLIFFAVREFTGLIESRVFEQVRWETRERLPTYDFLEGDVDFVRMLAGKR